MAVSENGQLQASDVVRTEADAKRAALRSIGRETMGGFQPHAVVLDRTRAHSDNGPIQRGDWVWLVFIINAGESTLFPIPLDLLWIRVNDGATAALGGEAKRPMIPAASSPNT
jgi:hypothetical protein